MNEDERGGREEFTNWKAPESRKNPDAEARELTPDTAGEPIFDSSTDESAAAPEQKRFSVSLRALAERIRSPFKTPTYELPDMPATAAVAEPTQDTEEPDYEYLSPMARFVKKHPKITRAVQVLGALASLKAGHWAVGEARAAIEHSKEVETAIASITDDIQDFSYESVTPLQDSDKITTEEGTEMSRGELRHTVDTTFTDSLIRQIDQFGNSWGGTSSMLDRFGTDAPKSFAESGLEVAREDYQSAREPLEPVFGQETDARADQLVRGWQENGSPDQQTLHDQAVELRRATHAVDFYDRATKTPGDSFRVIDAGMATDFMGDIMHFSDEAYNLAGSKDALTGEEMKLRGELLRGGGLLEEVSTQGNRDVQFNHSLYELGGGINEDIFQRNQYEFGADFATDVIRELDLTDQSPDRQEQIARAFNDMMDAQMDFRGEETRVLQNIQSLGESGTRTYGEASLTSQDSEASGSVAKLENLYTKAELAAKIFAETAGDPELTQKANEMIGQDRAQMADMFEKAKTVGLADFFGAEAQKFSN